MASRRRTSTGRLRRRDDPYPAASASHRSVGSPRQPALVSAPEPDVVGETEVEEVCPRDDSRSSSIRRSITYFRSPMAPRRSSLVCVPSSWTTTPGGAQAAKSAANRLFGDDVRLVVADLLDLRQDQSGIGRPPTGRSGFRRPPSRTQASCVAPENDRLHHPAPRRELLVGGSLNPQLGDDRADELGGSDVEGRVPGREA